MNIALFFSRLVVVAGVIALGVILYRTWAQRRAQRWALRPTLGPPAVVASMISVVIDGHVLAEVMSADVALESRPEGIRGTLTWKVALVTAPSVDLLVLFFRAVPIEVMLEHGGTRYKLTGPISKAAVTTDHGTGTSSGLFEMVGEARPIVGLAVTLSLPPPEAAPAPAASGS